MKRVTVTALFYLTLFLFLIAVFEGVACKFDTSGIDISPPPLPEEFYQCTEKMKHCAKGTEPVKVTLSGSAQHNVAGTYQIDDDFRVNDNLYVGAGNAWVVLDIEHDALKGGILVRTDLNHSNVSIGEFLGVDFPSFDYIKDLYIAYDARVNPKPQWLANTQNYEPVRDPAGKQLYILTSMPNKGGAWPTVRLALYRVVSKIKGHPIGDPMWSFPSNNCQAVPTPASGACAGKVQWPKGVADKDKAMYVAIVTRKDKPNCTAGTIDEQAIYEGCRKTEAEAKTQALQGCDDARMQKTLKWQNPDYFQCLPPVCSKVTLCPKKSTLVQTRFFRVSSVVEFDPTKYKSQANILFQNKQKFTKNTQGLIYFEYLLDEFGSMKQMRIDSMDLRIEPIDTDAGKFTDIFVSLQQGTRASCQEVPPPWAGDRPCTDYRVPADTFKAFLSAKKDGKLLLFDPVNKGNLEIKIDHKSRTFQIKGGPLSTAILANGKSLPLDIEIDLFGHFLNFAPHAVGGKESTKWVECAGGRDKTRSNNDPIFLDSGGSFEVYKDPIPQSAYEWYEDYTWPAQKLWGTGAKVVIQPHQMSLGVHRMTLLIRDPYGVADTDALDVEVRDTKPPKLTVPADIYFLVTPPDRPPVKLKLGTAWAYDICFGDVQITNDAPEDGRFPAGVTTVNWTAEDGTGNTDTGVQKVYVFTAPETVDPRTLVPHIKKFAKYVAGGIDQSQGAAKRCDPNELRAARPGGLAQSTSQMAVLAERMAVAPEREGEQREAIEMLRLSERRLGDADRSLESARATAREGDRRELCASAAGSLGDAGGMIAKAVPLLVGAGSGPPIESPRPARPPIEQPPPPPAPAPEAGLRCEEYAHASVAQVRESLERACGFRGGRWSAEFQGHHRWCLENTPAQAQAIIQQRAYALQAECAPRTPPFTEPPPFEAPPPPPAWGSPPPAPAPQPSGKETRCQAYAQMAVGRNQENLERGCGFGGPRWQSNHEAHYRWCLDMPQFLADMETNTRADDLGRCSPAQFPAPQPPMPGYPAPPPPAPPPPGPDNQARCAQYAQQAVGQVGQSVSRRCGFTGLRWSGDYNAHYNWCLGVPAGTANGETQARSSDLANRCHVVQ